MSNIKIDRVSETQQFAFEIRSDIGGRDAQQDFAYLCLDNRNLFAAVCDGMGGLSNGGLASSIAISSLQQAYKDFRIEKKEEVPRFLYEAITAADEEVHAAMGSQTGGTTVISLLVQDGRLYWASVGDSRLYIMRSGELLQATRDHNYFLRLSEMLNSRQITRERYESESCRGEALISYIGIGGLSLFDLTQAGLQLQSGDVLLLTTDGLYNAVSFDKLTYILGQDVMVKEKADLLLQAAAASLDKEFRDNTTFIVIKVI